MVHVGKLHGFAHFKRAAGQRLKPHNGFEQSGFAHAIWPNNAHNTVARQAKAQVVNKYAVAKGLVNVGGFQHFVAQARPHRNMNFRKVNVFEALSFRNHALVCFQTRLAFGVTCAGGRANPLQLRAHALCQLCLLLALRFHARRLCFQIRGVIAFVGVQVAAVNFANPFRNVVQKVAVVRYRQHRTLIIFQELFQPQNAFCVQVVGGLVQKQQVRGLQKQTAQRHAASLATRKHTHGRIGVGALQRVHGLGKLAV